MPIPSGAIIREMGRYTIDEMMSGTASRTADAIRPTEDAPVLAVDAYAGWGAAFRFSVDRRGRWFADCIEAARESGGAWMEIGSGGSYGDGWDTPWRPPVDGWDGEPILAMGLVGRDVETEDGEDQPLIAVYGFAAAPVVALIAEHGEHKRTVQIDSPVGAFVVVAVGEGGVRLTPVAGDGTTLGPPRPFR